MLKYYIDTVNMEYRCFLKKKKFKIWDVTLLLVFTGSFQGWDLFCSKHTFCVFYNHICLNTQMGKLFLGVLSSGD